MLDFNTGYVITMATKRKRVVVIDGNTTADVTFLLTGYVFGHIPCCNAAYESEQCKPV